MESGICEKVHRIQYGNRSRICSELPTTRRWDREHVEDVSNGRTSLLSLGLTTDLPTVVADSGLQRPKRRYSEVYRRPSNIQTVVKSRLRACCEPLPNKTPTWAASLAPTQRSTPSRQRQRQSPCPSCCSLPACSSPPCSSSSPDNIVWSYSLDTHIAFIWGRICSHCSTRYVQCSQRKATGRAICRILGKEVIVRHT